MPKLLLLKGLPASGKSTHAKELVAKGWKRVNKDDLRAMIDSGKHSKPNEKAILYIEFHIASYFLANGYNVVVDDTNFAYEKEWRNEALAHGAEFESKFFDVPVMECIERDAKRGEKSVGAKVIMGMYNRYLKPVHQENRTLQPAFIFDIDGTLAKMDGRSPYDYTKVSTDKVNENVGIVYGVLQEFRLADNRFKMIVMSGRDSSCKEDTIAWLTKHDIKPDVLLMRGKDDVRKDSIVKKELYDKHVKEKYNVIGVFDDRNQVVDMWRGLGLTVFQVDYGFF